MHKPKCPSCGSRESWVYTETQDANMYAPFHGMNMRGGIVIGDVELDAVDGESRDETLVCHALVKNGWRCYHRLKVHDEALSESEYSYCGGEEEE